MFSVYKIYAHCDWYSKLSATSVNNNFLPFLVELHLSTRPVLCHYAY